MVKMRASLLVASLLGLGVGVVLTRASEQAKEMKTETLLRQTLAKEFTPDREILVDIVEIPPNTTVPRHTHPGEEFHYYMEGEMEIHIDGAETVIGKPGTVGHVPYNRLHTAITKDKGGTVLVFRVHKEGAPVRTLESDLTTDKE
jgi:quercetin dioxygenase-like cupin family protein